MLLDARGVGVRLGRLRAFIHRGTLQGAREGALRGWTVAVKDNIAVQGWPLTCASAALEGYQAPYSADVVQAVLGEGAAVVGKTNMDEFGMGSRSRHSAHGAVRNPRDTTRTAGGSSGGSAAAVGAGAVRAGLGSDTGGSVRLPASYCGVAGFKPSWGVLSRWGLVSYAPACDVVGLLARTAADCAVLFEALLPGSQCRDPTALALAPPGAPVALRALTFGVPREWAPFVCDARALDAVLQGTHVRVRSVSIPSLRDAAALYADYVCMQAASTLARYTGVFTGAGAVPRVSADADGFGAHVRAYQHARLGPEVVRRVDAGRRLLATPGCWEGAVARVQQLQAEFARVFADGCDLVLGPTARYAAPALDAPPDPDEDVFTVPASLAGLPAISLPLGARDARGVAGVVGTQLVGPPRSDWLLLQAARELEGLFQ